MTSNVVNQFEIAQTPDRNSRSLLAGIACHCMILLAKEREENAAKKEEQADRVANLRVEKGHEASNMQMQDELLARLANGKAPTDASRELDMLPVCIAKFQSCRIQLGAPTSTSPNSRGRT